MKITRSIGLVLIAFVLTSISPLANMNSLGIFFSTAQAADNNGPQVVVKLRDTRFIPHTFQTTDLTDHLGYVVLAVPEGQTASDYATKVRGLPGVLSAEPDGPMKLSALTPADNLFSSQSDLNQVHVPDAWSETTGSTGLTVAVVDTGIDGAHDDLKGRTIDGYNFINNTAITAGATSDDYGHGTAIAGIIGANANNTTGIAGINWQAKLMPVKVADNTGVAQASAVASGITYAVDHGAKVINVSLGTTVDYTFVHDAIIYAVNHGALVIAAAGNHFSDDPPEQKVIVYPAAYSESLAVGSVASDGTVSDFSNTGSQLDMVAPGEQIVTLALTASHNSYSTQSGTSFSTAVASGIASLVESKFPSASMSTVRTILLEELDRPTGMGGQSFTNAYGNGLINAVRSVSFHAQFYDQTGYVTLQTGQSNLFQVRLKNTGQGTWYQNQINLGTDRSQDRVPAFIREDRVNNNPSGWVSANRVGLVEASVASGDLGTFDFYYSAPALSNAQTFHEYFRPVFEGVSWLEDYGIFWDVTVTSLSDTYQASYVGQNFHTTTVHPGDAIALSLQLKNTGTSTWQQGTVNLGTDRNRDRFPAFIREDQVAHNPSGWIGANRVGLLETSVAPGQTGDFTFYYTVPNNLPSGTYNEYFRPVADGISWMNDFGVFWQITVTQVTVAK